jgi:diguanylate cyclase (GGDEF)-like protein
MSASGSEPPALDAVTSDIEDTGVYSTAGLDASASDDRQAALICISGRSIGQMFILTRDEMAVGRAPESDIFLDDEGVSRHHAKVVRREGLWLIVDVGSTNGLFHRGERFDVHTLKDGDQVHLGTHTILQFRYQDEREVEFHELMQSFKTRDPLTEALNRRGFVSELEKEVGYARRHGEPLSLLMFDIDHFKRINDTFGHLAGDQVLRTISARIRELKRSEDAFARFGGEEFVILLRSTEGRGAYLLAERIRQAVEALEHEVEGRRIHCTISMGAATLTPEMQGADELLALADKRLYRAKARGRNRTEFEGP